MIAARATGMERAGVQQGPDRHGRIREVAVAMTPDGDPPAVRCGEVEHDLHRRGLARPVRPRNPVTATRSGLEAQVTHHRTIAVALGDTIHLDGDFATHGHCAAEAASVSIRLISASLPRVSAARPRSGNGTHDVTPTVDVHVSPPRRRAGATPVSSPYRSGVGGAGLMPGQRKAGRGRAFPSPGRFLGATGLARFAPAPATPGAPRVAAGCPPGP